MRKKLLNHIQLVTYVTMFLIALTGCISTPVMNSTKINPTKQISKTPTKTLQISFEPTTIPKSPFPGVTSTNTSEPVFLDNTCKKPTEDYSLLEINGHQLNQRTYDMLKTAKLYYQGVIDITGDAITQGSYTNAVEASFGTHAGGGAVDLSVMEPGTYTILYEDIEALVRALRLAGFAAWYRGLDELYAGSAAHIHAIAIGDRSLSLAAREQLAGPFGYFWGYNGLPTEDKIPIRDPHGGPIVCEWMIEKGYPNKTATPSADELMP